VAQGDPELALELQKAQIGSAALTDVDNSLLFKMAIEIVDFYPLLKLVDLSIVFRKPLPGRVYMLIITITATIYPNLSRVLGIMGYLFSL